MRCHTLHYILLDTSCCSDNLVYHFVLTKVAYVLSHTAWSHVGSIAEIDGAPSLFSFLWVFILLSFILCYGLVWKSPLDHFVHLFDCQTQISRLKTSMNISLEHRLVVKPFVEVITSHFLAVFNLRFASLQHVLLKNFWDFIFLLWFDHHKHSNKWLNFLPMHSF